jgi:type IV secretory pathway VirB2 component (pilin)
MEIKFLRKLKPNRSMIRAATPALLVLLVTLPAVAQAAGGSPWDRAFTAIGGFFTSTVARVGSLIAVVIGGWELMHGEAGSKRAVAGIVAGIGAALLAGNVIAWLYGV